MKSKNDNFYSIPPKIELFQKFEKNLTKSQKYPRIQKICQ